MHSISCFFELDCAYFQRSICSTSRKTIFIEICTNTCILTMKCTAKLGENMLNQRNLNVIIPVICIFIFLLWIRSRSLFCGDIKFWRASALVFVTFFINKNYQQRNSREKLVLILFIDIILLGLCGSWAKQHKRSLIEKAFSLDRKYVLKLGK